MSGPGERTGPVGVTEPVAVGPVAVLTVTSGDMARTLHDPALVALLGQFMAPAGSTVSDAARALGLSLNLGYRRVKRLEAAGLLRPVRQRPRAGRSVTVYAASARRYFIPNALFPAEDLLWAAYQPALAHIRRQLPLALTDSVDPLAGILIGEVAGRFGIWLGGQGGRPWPSESLAPTGQSPPAFGVAHDLRLDYAHAQQFVQDMQALVARYAALNTGGTYTLALFMVPAAT